MPQESGPKTSAAPLTPEYAAFISYRHAPADRSWALWLHKALETYRVPKRLVQRGLPRRIGRVFRDEDELPVSADLNEQIEAALAHSRFLIVVCSPRTPASRWVNQEVLRFREMGKGDRILALLVEGEPQTSFPPSLIEIRPATATQSAGHVERTEPLAADVRSRQGLRGGHLNRMAKLRLCARLLEIPFDDLRQRDQERRIRAMAISAVIAFPVVVAVLALIFFALLMRSKAEQLKLAAELSNAKTEEELRVNDVLRANRDLLHADTLGDDMKWQDARPILLEAGDLLKKRHESTLPIELRLWKSYKFAPPPIARFDRDGANVVVISADGRLVVSGHKDGSLATWDVFNQTTGRIASPPPRLVQFLPLSLMDNANPLSINALCLSADGHLVLSAAMDGTIILWDLGRKEARTVGSHFNRANCVAISPDGKLGLSGAWGGEVFVWDLVGGKQVKVLRRSGGSAHDTDAVAFTTDGRYAVVMQREGLTRYDTTNWQGKPFPGQLLGDLRSMAVSSDPDTIAVGDAYGRILLISVKSGAVAMVFGGHQSTVSRMAFRSDGKVLVSEGDERLVRLWDVQSGRQMHAMPAAISGAHDMAIAHDGRLLALADQTGVQVTLANVAAADIPVRQHKANQLLWGCELSHDGRLGAVATPGGVEVFDTVTGIVVRKAKINAQRAEYKPPRRVVLRFASDDSGLFYGDDVQFVRIDVADNSVSKTKTTQFGSIYGISDDGHQFAAQNAASRDLLIVDPEYRKVIQKFTEVGDVRLANFLPNGRILLTIDATEQKKTILGRPRLQTPRFKYVLGEVTTGKTFSVAMESPATAVETSLSRDATKVLFALGYSNQVRSLDREEPPVKLKSLDGIAAARLTLGGTVAVTAGPVSGIL